MWLSSYIMRRFLTKERSIVKLQECTFCKHLLICDATLGLGFLKEIQVHYDMNSKLKMFIEKLQMTRVVLPGLVQHEIILFSKMLKISPNFFFQKYFFKKKINNMMEYIWEVISFVEMESSKLINYSINTCQSGQGTTTVYVSNILISCTILSIQWQIT
jgi:hypothetical protein